MAENTQQHRDIRNCFVEPEWLEHHLSDNNLRVYDCSVIVNKNINIEKSLRQSFVYDSTHSEYELEYISGAVFASISGELSDLSLILLPENKFIEVTSNIGIYEMTIVVFYSTTETNWAMCIGWMLHAFILNSGCRKRTNECRPISKLTCVYPRGQLRAYYHNEKFVNKDEVILAIKNKNTIIINAPPSTIHMGENKITFGRKGRIIGSVNSSFTLLKGPNNECYFIIDKLQKYFNKAGVDKFHHIINYCGAGNAFSNNAFTFYFLGYSNVAVYYGSLREWGNDRSLPMKVDADIGVVCI